MDSSCPTCGSHTYRDTSLLPADSHAINAQLRASLEEVQTAIRRQPEPAILSELHRKRQELERRLGLIVYPVLTLPNEIVSRIFVDCLPDHGRVRPSQTALLAQICRRWRDIALETCELWSSVDMTSTRHITDQFLLTWFSRGKQYPLSWTLRAGFDRVYAFIPLIACRLWRLELCLQWTSYRMLANNHTSFPNLRQLALLPMYDSGMVEECPILGFSGAPLLRELKIAESPQSVKLDIYPLLTTLDIHRIPSATLLSILRQLPQLLHVVAHLHDDNSSGPAIIAPFLQSFILHGGCLNILDFLTLPGLRRLEIDKANIDFPSCLEFFRRSVCALDHLGIWVYEDTDGLAACLDAMPTVTSLCIDVVCDTSLIARILTKTPLLVPRLATLTLRFYDLEDYHLSPVVDFLCERFARGLVSVKFQYYDDDDEDDVRSWFPPADCLAKLNELISGGMDVELRWDKEYWNGGEYCPQKNEPGGATRLLSDDSLLINILDPCETFP
ncbi:hypothetical protein GGX14DRAFT_701065 [Mycena pura]|uniref:F-box domain-containing protein n=1 Tax=Mycena pura TaxID=153505 RepID=A0AAD6Y4K5_9AGAR|nr:hypothetical protein GGX14DRAFT_701065 [Mycena pura]